MTGHDTAAEPAAAAFGQLLTHPTAKRAPAATDPASQAELVEVTGPDGQRVAVEVQALGGLQLGRDLAVLLAEAAVAHEHHRSPAEDVAADLEFAALVVHQVLATDPRQAGVAHRLALAATRAADVIRTLDDQPVGYAAGRDGATS